MKKGILKKIILFSIFLLSFNIASAGIYDSYATQYYSPTSISGTSDLQSKLEAEVLKVINSGHLAPFRAIYGEGYVNIGQYYWYHAYDTIYTIAIAYPYLSASTQTLAKNYMKTEMTSYPLWNATYLDPNVGTFRQPDLLSSSERNSLPGYSARPKLFAMYALWLYANNTADWAYINSNWSSITSFYNTYRTEASSQYSSIAGSIGMYRMALQKTTPDTAMQATALNDVNTGMTNGLSFSTFANNSLTAYTFTCGERWSYCQDGMFTGFHFLDISPEIGKYFFDNSSLKSLVLGSSSSDIFSLSRAEYIYPLWYLAQSPQDSVYFGEGSAAQPDARAMIFPIKAWVQKQSSAQLRNYLDVPDALIGDYFFLQNLTRTIQASGTECWENVTTTIVECSGSVSPTPTPTPPPPTPTPPPPAGSNTALQFNPIVSAVDTTEGVDFGSNIPGLGSVFTVETLFYFTGDNTTYDVILGRQQWGVQDWVVSIDGGKAFGSVTYDGVHGGTQSVNLTSATTITPNVWHHVALVANGTQFSLYLDGRLEATSTQSGPIFNSGAGARVFMGRKQNPTQSAVFHGSVDETRISNVARYSGSIYTIPTAAFVNDANTLALWHLDDASGTSVVDSSGRGYNGTISLTPRWITGYTFGTITQPTANKFVIGDRVQTNANLNVRATASPTGTLLGTQTSGALGTVTAGPTVNGGFTWWNINYDTGVDGWSAEDFLNKYTSPTPPPPTPTPTPTPPPPTPAGAPTVSSIISSASSVGLYSKIEWNFDLSKTYANPYYYYDASDTPTSNAGTPGANQTWFGVDGVSVDLRLTSPSGKVIVVPAFWMEDYTRIQSSGSEILGRKNNGKWVARFTPSEIGTYTYYFTAQDKVGTGTSGSSTFTVTNSSNKGFIKTSSIDPRFMEYSNGSSYIPIASGATWATDRNLYSYSYESNFSTFNQNGINLLRIWDTSDFALGVEGAQPVWIRQGFVNPGAALGTEIGTSNVRTGLRAAKPSSGQGWYQRLAVTEPTRQHKLVAWIRTASVSDQAQVVIRVGTAFNTGTLLGQVTSDTSASTAYTKYEVTFTPNNQAVSVSLLQSAGVGGVYIDDLQFGPTDVSGNIIYNIITDEGMERHFAKDATGNDPEVNPTLARPIGNYFNQAAAYQLDKIIESAQANGVAIQLCSCSGPWFTWPANQGQINWSESWVLKSWQRNFRYRVARWGYSPAVLAWELHNEDGHITTGTSIYNFLQSYGTYQKNTDPYGHLRTNSQNSQAYSPGMWSSSAMDLANYHDYLDFRSTLYQSISNDEVNFVKRFVWCLTDTRGPTSPYCNGLGLGDGSTWSGLAKPWVWGEIGIWSGGTTPLQNGEAGKRFLHNLVWTGLFSPIGTTPVDWYNDIEDSIARTEKYASRKAASAFFSNVDYDGSNFVFFTSLSDIPNGYTGETVSSTDPKARVLGMRRSDKKASYLWVQNRDNIWSTAATSPTSISPILTVGNLLSSDTYTVEIWNTSTGSIINTSSVTPNSSGTISIPISGLTSDVAVKIISTSPAPTPTPPPPTPTPPPSTKFTVGQRVQTSANVNVRSTADTAGTLLGTQSTGSLGNVVAGPTAQGGFNWWQINYDTGADGWSVEDFLVVAAATPLAGDLNLDHIINSLDWSLMNSAWFTNNTTADLRVDGQVNSLDFSILSSNWGRTW